jgi:hypothetical protein
MSGSATNTAWFRSCLAKSDLPLIRTHFALHCTAPGDIEAITPQHAPWRTNEYALFASGAVAEWCAALGIIAIGYRDIQALWVSGQSMQP